MVVELPNGSGLVESQTLNVSGSSAGNRSPRHSGTGSVDGSGHIMSPTSAASDEDSDWDSWSDDEEEVMLYRVSDY